MLDNAVLVDATSATPSITDATLAPGQSFELDLGTSETQGWHIRVSAGSLDTDGHLPVTILALGATYSPTAPPTIEGADDGPKPM